jgi:competence protein ComEA
MNDQTTPLDLNSASLDELAALPTITPVLAESIITARPFSTVDDLIEVKGIGPVTVERLRGLVLVSQPPAEEAQGTPPEEVEPSSEEGQLLEVDELPPDPSEIPVSGEEVLEEEIDEQPSEDEPQEITSDEEAVEVLDGEIIEDDEAEEPTDGLEQVDVPDEEPIPVVAQVVEELPPPPAYVTRSQAFWIALGGGLVSFVMAICFMSVLLLSINGGLHYAKSSDISRIQSELDIYSTNAEAFNDELQDLGTRIDALETLEGRISQVEQDVSQLETDFETMNSQIEVLQLQSENTALQLDDLTTTVDELALQVDDINQQLEEMTLQIDALLTITGRFTEFIDGLRDLLDNLPFPKIPEILP